MKDATYFAPGKLFIAGEYTVLHGGFALLVPIQWGIHVTLKPARLWRIHNPSFPTPNETYSTWKDLPPSIITQTLKIFSEYLSLINLTLTPFTITIVSHLGTQEEKYGLGSSGAIIVALLGALLNAYELPSNPLLLFKLSVRVAYDAQRRQSFADMAISAFHMPLQYRAPKLALDSTLSLSTFLNSEWPQLLIQPWQNTLPNPWVIFTNQSSDSKKLVPFITQRFNESQWIKMTMKADEIIQQIINHADVTFMSKLNRLMQSFDTTESLFTPAMNHILNIAEKHHAYAKPSGAGGGDCMLVWPGPRTNVDALKKQLRASFKILSVF